MSSESKSFSKPDQEFTQFNNAHMAHYKFKDGKVIYMETGATKLPK
jgi:hypothetical protein